jgi:hypothetical protein
MVDLDTALGEQLLNAAIGQPKRRYQRTARTMLSDRKRKPATWTAEWQQREGGGGFPSQQSGCLGPVASDAPLPPCPEAGPPDRRPRHLS